MPNQDSTREEMNSTHRRSQRVLVDVPVIIRGELKDKNRFHEETFTLVVSAHGGLVFLAAKVEPGQRITLVNPETKGEQEGRVVYIGSPYAGMAQVGIGFTEPAPDFWPITCPPDDWKIARP